MLHEGQIAEMRTGEGKTLVATLPAYVNALTGVWDGHCTAERCTYQRLPAAGQGGGVHITAVR